MSRQFHGSAHTRRQLLASSGALAVAACSPPATQGSAAAGASSPGPRLTVAATTQRLLGADRPATSVLGYGGSSPGPLLRSPQGRPFRMTVENRLDEDTTVHWHGVRLPNAMDGVPGLTQPPIRPGGEFTYAFTPPTPARSGTTPMTTAWLRWGAAWSAPLSLTSPSRPRLTGS